MSVPQESKGMQQSFEKQIENVVQKALKEQTGHHGTPAPKQTTRTRGMVTYPEVSRQQALTPINCEEHFVKKNGQCVSLAAPIAVSPCVVDKEATPGATTYPLTPCYTPEEKDKKDFMTKISSKLEAMSDIELFRCLVKADRQAVIPKPIAEHLQQQLSYPIDEKMSYAELDLESCNILETVWASNLIQWLSQVERLGYKADK